jgi:hypothetical protein
MIILLIFIIFLKGNIGGNFWCLLPQNCYSLKPTTTIKWDFFNSKKYVGWNFWCPPIHSHKYLVMFHSLSTNNAHFSISYPKTIVLMFNNGWINIHKHQYIVITTSICFFFWSMICDCLWKMKNKQTNKTNRIREKRRNRKWIF